jgi:hypothetical protein
VALLVIATLCAAVVSLGPAAAAPGASKHPTFRPRWQVVSHGGAATDGPYTILWSQGSGVIGTLINELSGQRTRVLPPSTCPAPVGGQVSMGDSWLIAACPQFTVGLYSLADGQWKTVSMPAVCRHTVSTGPSCQPAGVGTDWIRYDEDRRRLGDRSLFQNIVTGAVRNDPTNAHTLPDLDAPLLTKSVCAPLRVPGATSENTLVLDGRFAVLSNTAGNFLEHCATHLDQLLTDALWVTVAPGEVMWVSQPNSLEGMFLPSRRRFTVSRPPRALMDDVEISARHIYVFGSTRHSNSVVWSAPVSVLRGS